MSLKQPNRSADLRRLRDEGYHLSIVAGLLLVRSIPYVTHDCIVDQGMLVVPLDMRGDQTVSPESHVALWSGSEPCDADGKPLQQLIQGRYARRLHPRVSVDHSLCNKPLGREFCDYHELVESYVKLISGHALTLSPGASARSHRGPIEVDDRRSPFKYMDIASARTGTADLAHRLSRQSVGIVGLGGTGAYVLDLVAKTPVPAIHLYDDDLFLQHNAFRCPGAASLEELDAGASKVDHLSAIYSRMHNAVIPHRLKLTEHNLAALDYAEFVFLCVDDSRAKRPIIDRLERTGRSFIDVGMGVEHGDRGLFGTLRVTTSTPEMREHVTEFERIPFIGGGEPDAYASNIQIADLNALNAALAVVRWKRLNGFYLDQGGEHHSTYDVDGNHLGNADLVSCEAADRRKGSSAGEADR